MVKNSLFLILFIALVLLVSCTAKEQRDPNVIVVATSGDMPPFNYYNANNELVGFDIDVAKEIVQRLERKIEFQQINFSRLIPSLTSNRIDMVVSAIDNLEEIQDMISYSEPYMYEITFFVIKDDVDLSIDSVFEVHGSDQRIGVTNGTTAARFLRDQGLDENLSIYPSKTDQYLALTAGKIIGTLADEDELVYINEKMSNLNIGTDSKVKYPMLKKVGINPLYDHYMTVAINKDNEGLLKAVNKAIKDMKEDGTLSRLGQKWLKREPFPRYATDETKETTE